MKPAKLRPLAEQDLVEAVRYWAQEGGLALGERVFGAALSALKQIEQTPAIGSPRLGLLCEIAGLRSWRLKAFPMQWLYFEASEHLDVIRLLGDRQDVIAILTTKNERRVS